jgi:hypothetical protein
VNKAITATTALSPQNDPETELKGGAALLDMVGNQRKHTVRITPELRQHTAARIAKMGGPEIPKEWEGKDVRISRLHSSHIASIASSNVPLRKTQPVQSTANFDALGALRRADEIKKGVEHLRGERSEEKTIDPHSSPKVWSYKESTKNSVPGSKTHLEYLARGMDYQAKGPEGVQASEATPAGFREEAPAERLARTRAHVEAGAAGEEGFGSARHALASHRATMATLGQGPPSLPDIRPMRRSQEGVLSHEAHTAEDTWQQAISTRQTPRSFGASSVAKTVASTEGLASEKQMTKTAKSGATVAPDPRIGGNALNHAINNYATRLAARHLHLPATMVQETGWTEERIQADKDPGYRREMVAKQAEPLGRQFSGANPNPTTPPHLAAAKAAYERATANMPIGGSSGAKSGVPQSARAMERPA